MKRLLTIFALLAFSAPAQSATLCTLIADAATGKILLEQGRDCDTPTTPASTFKVPLSIMGFDAGFLADAHNPALPFKQGYADWGGEEWRQTTDPTRWMDFSVVWYSQVIARSLGAEQLTRYAQAFNYGNADFSGDPGADNGLERAWIGSSLKVTPREQLAFMSRLSNKQLPVSKAATQATLAIMQQRTTPDGWQMLGKTGSAFPRKANGAWDRAHGWGWYVGLAKRDGHTLAFVRLTQDDGRETRSAGLRTRDGLLRDWPDLLP
jgi:beta-lactamase class D